jgi:hypothetical protein
MYAQLIVHRSLEIFRLVHYVSSNDIILLYNLLQVLQAIRIIFHSFLDYLEMNIIVKGWVRVTRSLILYGCFVDRCLSFCTFSSH